MEMSERVWREFCQYPGPRTAHAMRLLLGLSVRRAAMLANLPTHMVSGFERRCSGIEHWHSVSRRLNDTYKAAGATWCEPELHEGAFYVVLNATCPTGATDRQAINVALALMGHRAEDPDRHVLIDTLAKRVASRLGLPLPEVLADLRGKEALPERVRKECFRQLGDGLGGAGAYFEPTHLGGWQKVGCDYAGCWW